MLGDDSRTPTISDVNILLPHTYREPYRLRTKGGCYQWKSHNPDIVTVRPVKMEKEGLHCSKEAEVYVTPVSTYGGRRHTWIEAHDANTKSTLACDVYVDKIVRIDVETTTRSMLKGDVER